MASWFCLRYLCSWNSASLQFEEIINKILMKEIVLVETSLFNGPLLLLYGL